MTESGSGSAETIAAVERSLARIAAMDGELRAFLTVDTEGARRAAVASPPAAPRLLEGIPVAIKDLTDTAGLRTTYGSALFESNIPAADDLIVARLRAAGAIILGKTMTPEFGFGAICGNRLGGPTATPWDTSLTSGGSSGGAAAAVAAGMVPLAHGTDFGGSVRTPASFCGVASIRPTPGLLPNPRRGLAYDMLATTGFLARDVAMLRRALAATAGAHRDDPLSRPLARARRHTDGLRIAATEDFGVAPVARVVRSRFREAVAGLPPALGRATPAHPDCTDAFDIFHTLRPALIAQSFGALAAKHGDDLTPTVRWWIERASGIDAVSFLAAEAARTALYRRFLAFFDSHDVLLAPAASVMPWCNDVPDVLEIDGQPLDTIADYLAITFIVSLVGFPVVTLPAPLLGHHLPFGVQLIGPPGSDLSLLAIARRFEREAGWSFVKPPLWRGSP
jgi:amidase